MPRDNWEVLIRCRDCSAEFKVSKPDYSCDFVPLGSTRGRLVLIGIPQECPRCHNLHVVEAAEGKV